MKWLLLFPLAACAQPMPTTFAWDAPSNPAGIIAYELEWGPQDSAQVPVHETQFTVQILPLDFNRTVSVRSVSSTSNSEPTTINVYNVVAYLEETEDFTNWNVIKSVQMTGERKPRSFLRVRLDTQ